MKKLILVGAFCFSMALSFGNTTTVPTSKEVPGIEKTERSALAAICRAIGGIVLNETGDKEYALEVTLECLGY